LNETKSDIKRRQKIGRGLRLCVNQNGNRLHGFDINSLTVMANESYEDFAKGLQKEIESGIKFGVIETHIFATIPVEQANGELAYLGVKASEDLHFKNQINGYIDENGKVTDELRQELKDKTFKLPDWFKVNTPIGAYNPNWAVLMEKDGDQRLYFVLETKGNMLIEALRPTESAKIECGRAHFKALDNEIRFEAIDSFERFIKAT
jgi:restriction endonuclease